MSQQINQDNVYTERRLYEIMPMRLFQYKNLPQGGKVTSLSKYNDDSQHPERRKQVACRELRESTWSSLFKFLGQKMLLAQR